MLHTLINGDRLLYRLVEMEQFVSIKDAAKLLHLHEDTISDYLRKSVLKGEKRPLWGGRGAYKWFIPQSELEAFKPPHVFSRHIPLLDKECRLAIAWTIASEGTITINPYFSKSHKGFYLAYPNIVISNTELDFIQAFHELMGKTGTICQTGKATENRKASWQWQLRSIEGCLRLLEQIKDYLPIKKKQAQIVIDYCHLRLRNLTKPYTNYELELINQIRSLNTRGRKIRREIEPSAYNHADLRSTHNT